jgi:hypothetical protein
VADFLDTKVKEIEARLRELQPLIEEYHRLEAAASALENVDGGAPPTRAPARSANGNRRGRPRGSRGGNTRATQAVELVRLHPGVTIPDLADHMGIKPNYLYRILPQLQDEGKVERRDKGWHPV